MDVLTHSPRSAPALLLLHGPLRPSRRDKDASFETAWCDMVHSASINSVTPEQLQFPPLMLPLELLFSTSPAPTTHLSFQSWRQKSNEVVALHS